MSKTFYAKTACMDDDDIDDLILDSAKVHGLELERDDITDELRQHYVDISFDSMFISDAVMYGEDYYARKINERIVAKAIELLGK